MRYAFAVLCLFGLLFLVPRSEAKTKSSATEGGTVVIVFKDGHQQSFPMTSISRGDFKDAAGNVQSSSGVGSTMATPMVPGRRSFLGKWQVGEGGNTSSTFVVTLEENGTARRSIGAAHGTWTYVDGEAQITWDDGWRDIIKKAGSDYEKFAFEPGKPLTDSPSNVARAKRVNPRPI
jgi:hypothetical protein